MTKVASLWRYPIKAHGREQVPQTDLIAGRCMPGDRVWAIAHQNSKATNAEWARCGNFTRACNSPTLQAIALTTAEDGRLTLTHPERPTLHVDPDTDEAALLNWLKPLMKDDKFQPSQVISVPDRGMTDANFPSITLCNHASHKAVEHRAGLDISIHRWRGNIWLDDLPAWQETDWVGKIVQIGEAQLKVIEPTTRCKATAANPQTGLRDLDVLALLDSFGHQDFSMQAEVIRGGSVRPTDKVIVL
jgi:uncharacterized protein YcbX